MSGAISAFSNDRLDALGLSVPKNEETSNDELGMEAFLELMTTQLTNQNPLEPMENGDFLGQIAQFGTVNGIQGLQNSFSDLNGSLTSGQTLQAASLVGRTVVIPTDTAQLIPGENVKGVLDVPRSMSDIKVNVFSNTGQLVRQIEMGGASAGPLQMAWDGLDGNGNALPAGQYTIKAEGQVAGGETLQLNTAMGNRVEAVTLGGNKGIQVRLPGLGDVPFTQIREVL